MYTWNDKYAGMVCWGRVQGRVQGFDNKSRWNGGKSCMNLHADA